MPKGFGIGQHIGQILGTSKLTRTFGHTVVSDNNWSCKSLSFKLMKEDGRGVVGPSYASIGETPAAPRFVKWGVSSHGKKEGCAQEIRDSDGLW